MLVQLENQVVTVPLTVEEDTEPVQQEVQLPVAPKEVLNKVNHKIKNLMVRQTV